MSLDVAWLCRSREARFGPLPGPENRLLRFTGIGVRVEGSRGPCASVGWQHNPAYRGTRALSPCLVLRLEGEGVPAVKGRVMVGRRLKLAGASWRSAPERHLVARSASTGYCAQSRPGCTAIWRLAMPTLDVAIRGGIACLSA